MKISYNNLTEDENIKLQNKSKSIDFEAYSLLEKYYSKELSTPGYL